MNAGSTDELKKEKEEANGLSLELEGWTKAEKLQLIECLKARGSHDIDYMATVIRTKSKSEIRNAISYYKRKMETHPLMMKKKRLENWEKLLTDSLAPEDLHTEYANAFRMIAKYEDIPAPFLTEGIDFKAVYESLANALEGKPITNDKEVNEILQMCLVETEACAKEFISPGNVKQIIENINTNDFTYFKKPTDNERLASIRHLLAQRAEKPLGIAEQYLKLSLYGNK